MVLHWPLCGGSGDRMSAVSMKETPLQLYLTAVINICGSSTLHMCNCVKFCYSSGSNKSKEIILSWVIGICFIKFDSTIHFYRRKLISL